MKKLYNFIFALITLASTLGSANAQANECVDATELSPSSTCIYTEGTFTDATASATDPASCQGTIKQDVWYKFTATTPINRITINIGVNQNISYEVYKSSCDGERIACKQLSLGFASDILGVFEVGTEYFIRLKNTSSSNLTTNFTICVRSLDPEPNDQCATASILTPELTVVNISGSFNGTGNENGPATCVSTVPIQDVWYRFTATDRMMEVKIPAIQSFNIAMEIYEETCASTPIACINAGANNVAEKFSSTTLTVGTTYLIRVMNLGTNYSSQPFNISLQRFPVADNDLLENAITLTPNVNCQNTTGTFSAATITGNGPSCYSGSTQDVWYTFIATEEMMRVNVGGPSGVDKGFELYKGTDATQLVACVNQAGMHVPEAYTSNSFEIGATYTVRVFNAGLSASTADFTICVMSYPTPANDVCADATLITPNLECAPVIGTFSGATTPDYTVCTNAIQDVWYKFIATEPEMTISLSGPEGLDHGFKVYAQACGGTEITCVNEGAMGLEETAVLTELTIGTIYFIQVYNVTTMNTGEFELCLIGSPTETCPSIVEISAPATICENTEVVFTSSIVNGGDAPMFQWLLNGNNVGDNNSTLTLTSVNNNDVVQLVIISNATCAPTNAMAFSNEITIATTATVTPTFDLPTSICVDAAFVLPTTSVNNIAGTWSPAFNNQATTTYTFTSTAACTAETTATIEVVALDGTVTVQNKVLNVQSNGTSFQWIDCATDLPIDGATAASFAPATPGSFAVIVTKNDCEWTSECFSVDNLSIEKVATTFSISPNPFTTAIQVTSEEVNAIYSVVNTTGQTVKTGVLEGTTTTVELSELETGYYFITIGQQTTKLIKH